MLIFLQSFTILMVGYQIIHTALVFGIMDGQGHQIVSISKDLIRLGACVVLLYHHTDKLMSYLHKRGLIRLITLATIGRSIGLSYYLGISWSLILIGFKYVLYPFVILLTTIRRGYVISDQQLNQYLKWFANLSVGVGIVGVIWFICKITTPDLMQTLGYGPVGDFVVGSNPPVYYRTGTGGRPRYSGLMAGPNNLSYLLVGLSPLLIYLWRGSQSYVMKKVGLVLSLLTTLSRSAWIASIVQYLIRHRHQIRSRPPINKVMACIGICLALMIAIVFKYDSSIGHIHSTLQALSTRIQQPLGYGLGYSGPSALHHGSIIPENTYLQRLIDIGIIGTVGLISMIGILIRHIYTLTSTHQYQPLLLARSLGMIGLGIQGMFLHVLEDSTVNYILLILGGLLIGYTSQTHHFKSK